MGGAIPSVSRPITATCIQCILWPLTEKKMLLCNNIHLYVKMYISVCVMCDISINVKKAAVAFFLLPYIFISFFKLWCTMCSSNNNKPIFLCYKRMQYFVVFVVWCWCVFVVVNICSIDRTLGCNKSKTPSSATATRH